MGHHYIPQTYLRFFQDLSRPGFIWLYRRKQEPRLVNIRKVANEVGMYTFTAEGKPTLEVEQMFARLEGKVTPILKRINQAMGPIEMTWREKQDLAWFTAYQLLRTPVMRRAKKEMILDIAKDIAEATNSEFKPPTSRDESLEKLSLLAALDEAQPLSRILMGKRLEVLRSEIPLVTSDHPVGQVNPPEHLIIPNFFELFLPVGSRAAILWRHEREEQGLDSCVTGRPLKAADVRIINQYAVKDAEEFLFTSERMNDVASLFDQTTRRQSRIEIQTL